MGHCRTSPPYRQLGHHLLPGHHRHLELVLVPLRLRQRVMRARRCHLCHLRDAAAAVGFFLWKVFVTLDSARFPICSYGDLFLRVFGPKTRHFINVTQSFQQFCTVMVLILG